MSLFIFSGNLSPLLYCYLVFSSLPTGLWAFKQWCWRRLLRVPWTVKRSNLSILKEISPEYSLEGLILKLKLQYLMWRTDSLEKNPNAGKDWRWEEKGMTGDEMVGWPHRLSGRDFWVSSRIWWRTERPGMLQSMESQRIGLDWVTELNSEYQVFSWKYLASC